ncbi:hypothetical protein ACH4OY_15685 [Micromonospora rubida]|uniref:Uncharacterized protein n=1 Tax=Micromonospora rubida TaxID=2697657 RepID=A0ABW7SMI4_9ACTN
MDVADEAIARTGQVERRQLRAGLWLPRVASRRTVSRLSQELGEEKKEPPLAGAMLDALHEYLGSKGHVAHLEERFGVPIVGGAQIEVSQIAMNPSEVLARIAPNPFGPRINEEEVAILVRQFFPNASEQECTALAYGAGFYRQVVEQACAYLADNPALSVQDFCTALSCDPISVIESLAIDEGPSIAVTCRRLIEQVEREHPQSLALLEFLACTSHEFVPAELTMAFLTEKRTITVADLPSADFVFWAALNPLGKLGIVYFDGCMLRMNILIHAIVRQILIERTDEDRRGRIQLWILNSSRELGEKDLWRSGWGTYTLAGRLLCVQATQARVRDQLRGGLLQRAGKLGGVAWNALISALWFRHIVLARQMAINEGTLIWHSSTGEFPEESAPTLAVTETQHPVQKKEYDLMLQEDMRILALGSQAGDEEADGSENNSDPWDAIFVLVEDMIKPQFDMPSGIVNLEEYLPVLEIPMIAFRKVTQILERSCAEFGEVTPDAQEKMSAILDTEIA